MSRQIWDIGSSQRGAATIYLLVVVMLCLLLATAGIAIGELATARARVSGAADLAALAAADNSLDGAPCDRARAVAMASAAQLVSCRQDGADIVVMVEAGVPIMVARIAQAAGQRSSEIRVVARAGPAGS